MTRTNKAIITCAITGGTHLPCMSDHLPITPDQIADEALAAAEAGAAVVHLHARNAEDGRPAWEPEVYAQFLSKIKQGSDVIVNITSGGTMFSFEERLAAPLQFSPEICSFNMGPMNLGTWRWRKALEDKVKYDWERQWMDKAKSVTYINTFENMEYIAKQMGDQRGTRFEFECFDVGHIHALKTLWDENWIKPPFFIQFVMGFTGGIQADPEHLMHMKQTADRLFGTNYEWSALGAGKHQMRIVSMAAILGGHVRVGLEDSLWYGKGVKATSNSEQVGRIKRILEELSIEIATPDEAREILHTKGADKVNF